MSDRRTIVVLVVVAFLLVVCVRQTPLARSIDATDYHHRYRPAADAIRAGDGLYVGGVPAVDYPPGYALLLAGASVLPGGDQTEVTVINAVSVAIAAVLLFLVVRRLASRRAARLAGWGLLTYPILVYAAAAPGSDLPFIALVLASVLVFLVALDGRLWMAAACGGLVGLAALVRPAGAALCLVLALLALAWRRDRRGLAIAAVLLAANLAAVLPWELWVYRQTDDVVVLGSVGMATAVSGLTLAGRDEADGREPPLPASVEGIGRRALARQGDLLSMGGMFGFLSTEWDRSPPAVVSLFGLKAMRSWYGTDSIRYEAWIALVQLPYVLLAVVGAWVCRRQRLVGLCIAVTAYFWLTTILAVSIVRYLLPGLVFVIALAALGVERAWLSRRYTPAPER